MFSNLDLTQGYNQFQLCPEDQALSAFTTPSGRYQWKVLSFGLSNAPSVFSRAMQAILQSYVGKFVLVYLDDIAILSKTKEEHLQHLRLVFERLHQAGLKLKLPKCTLLQKEVTFLGHVLSDQGEG